MKNWKYTLTFILSNIFFFTACNPEIDVPTPNAGTVDFTKYVAVGNSLTAGFGDGGLYAEGQLQSYPNILANQVMQVSSIDFKQPDIPGTGSGYRYLTSLAPTFDVFPEDPAWLEQLTDDFNNLGVPGIRVRDVNLAAYGADPDLGNPYFYRMLGGKSPFTTYAQLVDESEPTFFTNWMGNNDALGYATAGGAAGIEGSDPVLGFGGLTPVDLFRENYGTLMTSLTKNDAKGVLLTIPNVTNIPFFTTVPYIAIPLDAATAQLLMSPAAFGGYNLALDGLAFNNVITPEEAAKRKVNYAEGLNPILLQDNDLDDLSQALGSINPALAAYGQTRQATADDLILLTAQGVLGELADPNNPLSAIGVAVPLNDALALTSVEINNLRTYTNDYNEIIKGYASTGEIAVIDMDELFERGQDGIFQDGVFITADFITGGAFSLDGIHLTPRGYALVANEIISKINQEFNSNLSPVLLNNYRDVVLP